MSSTRSRLLSLPACSLLCFVAPAASAVVVAPGTTQPLVGTTSAAQPALAAMVVTDVLRPFEIHNEFGAVLIRGNLQDRVSRSIATGRLIFGPRLRDLEAPGGTAWIVRLQVRGYDGVITDVEYRKDALGNIGPDAVTRSSGGGDELDFGYQPSTIVPPDSALPLSIATDVEDYAELGMAIITAQTVSGGFLRTGIFGTNAPDPDSDRDGIPDSLDLCPATPDPDQIDSDHNGIGDPCECGDQTGNGHVDVHDLIAIHQAIYDPSLVTPLCDANFDGLCTVADIVAANAKIFGAPAYCAAYPAP